ETAEKIREMGQKSVAVNADVSRRKDARAMVEKAAEALGGVDILINNAGVSKPSMLVNMTEEDWDLVMNVHLKGIFNTSQAAAPYMKAQQWGRIINVVSTAGLFGTIGQINYASAKAGVIGFTKSASRELGKKGINVNAVCPGITKTDMTKKLQEDENLCKKYTSRIQLGRFAEISEIVPIFVFLASDDAGYITGQVLGVDGGYIG
ncbi:MAG TPA: SDR family oxidoreductase, partial [Desulfobacteraceae bacterium]|nr:SDR family oxidoreductase [Desulfobacteraceae bacterium]